MVFRGPSSCGKRTLVSVFIRDLHVPPENVLKLCYSTLKQIDIRALFTHFIETKTTNTHKWVILQNIHKFPMCFHSILYNLFKVKNVTVIIVEDEEHIALDQWCCIFHLKERTDDDFLRIAQRIYALENLQWDEDTYKQYQHALTFSNGTLTLFLQILQSDKREIWTPFLRQTLPYEELTSKECTLREKVRKVQSFIQNGYSCYDIAVDMYTYLRQYDGPLEDLIEFGRLVEYYATAEKQESSLYGCLARIWLRHHNFDFLM